LLEQTLADDPSHRPESADRLRQLLIQTTGEHGSTETIVPRQSNRSDKTDIIIAAILSAYPGAGATFGSIGLSKALSDAGVVHALVECPGREPELYGLLDGERRKPKYAAFADSAGQSDPVPAWRQGSAFIYALDPRRNSPGIPDAAFAGWLSKLGVPLVLLDVSSGWDNPGMADWLAQHVHSLWWMADCLPAKWSVRRQEAGSVLHGAIRQRGIPSRWIANRDFRFPQREQWLSCFPERPVLTIPQFPMESVVHAVWRGDGTPPAKSASDGNRAFQRWAGAVIESQGSYHLFPQSNNHVTMNS
jgi:hypothetical protein